MCLVNALPQRHTLQYVVGMDNYFTLSCVIKAMIDARVACVGTARACRGWPPKDYRAIDDDWFNTMYSLTDDLGFKIIRWVNKNIVTMVSTVHTGDEKIRRERWRPRPTFTNRDAIRTLWRDVSVKSVDIPCVIND